jgi:hypothetical protein
VTLNMSAGTVHTSDSAESLYTCVTDAETSIAPTNANSLVTGTQAMPSLSVNTAEVSTRTSPHSCAQASCHDYPGILGLSNSELRGMIALPGSAGATSPVPPYPVDSPTTPIRQMVKSGASPRSVTTWSRDHVVRFDAYAADVARGVAPQSPVSCFKLEYAHNVVTPAPGRPLHLKLSCTHNCD